jgi:hypothetical protein
MRYKNLLQCAQSVLDFIEEDYTGMIPSTMQNVMDQTLIRNGWSKDNNNGDMIGFTKYLNERFELGYIIEDQNGVRNFFTKHSRQFYKSIIREQKLKQLGI